VKSLSLCQFRRMLVGFLKVCSVLDQCCAQRAHGRVLLAAVPVRNHDDRAQSDAACCERNTLAVISASRRNHAGHVGFAPPERIHVDQAATDLERSHGRVVFVLTHVSAPTRAQSSGHRI